MAEIYTEDWSAGNSLFTSMYHYDADDDGADPLYPHMWSQEGGYINGDGHYDHDPAYTGEFETYQQCGFWVKGAGPLEGGGAGIFSGPGFWDGSVGWVEASYLPSEASLEELHLSFFNSCPVITVATPAGFIMIGVDVHVEDDVVVVYHANEGSHDFEVEVIGAPMPVAGEPYVVRLEWQVGTFDPDLLTAAADGFVRVYVNDQLMYEAMDISLLLNWQTVPGNRIDSVQFGYFGLLGPLETFTINDEAYVTSELPQFGVGGTESPLFYSLITFKEIP